MTVGIVSCVYGDYEQFFPRWSASIDGLTRQPDEAHVVYGPRGWRHPQAELLDRAIRRIGTEWVWVLDIDDEALPDGLDGLDALDADVWQFGYTSADGTVQHVPPRLDNDEYLAMRRNPYASSSAFRVAAYVEAGGYPDVAFQDWALWRRFARAGARFAFSDRAHYVYHRHADTRSARELTPARRAANESEMLAVAP